ncbi:hypothetical protein IEQ34_018891 [Dendrobium chrysotoxum]|uniref:Legumain prodomain domain-containing protein n=1 Tax=Dendrobium chrysotoxum TaxID=161865 RepID=A0AAV7G7W4_DENCH|nr:hypothetical protein IEQ34_018891 [Dendrobium chrysotoxum]
MKPTVRISPGYEVCCCRSPHSRDPSILRQISAPFSSMGWGMACFDVWRRDQEGGISEDNSQDYVGDDINVKNFFAVLLGDKKSISSGSGKVVDSGPDDHIFIFYSGHDSPGLLVIYLEACESGSIFEGLLPEDISIYATTTSNAVEHSWGTYCLGGSPSPPSEYLTCLGDLYSISWMKDRYIRECTYLPSKICCRGFPNMSSILKINTRTLADNTYNHGSHVMQYGELGINEEKNFLYIGLNPTNDNSIFIEEDNSLPFTPSAVNQRDADLIYYWHKFINSPEGSSKKLDAQKGLLDILTDYMHVDNSINLIGKLLFGSEKGIQVLSAIRKTGLPLVDDWACLKSMVRIFELHCGSLSQYGIKHMCSIANICNAGISNKTMAKVSAEVCSQISSTRRSFLRRGFSA